MHIWRLLADHGRHDARDTAKLGFYIPLRSF
jgi:hypothetical protein